MHTKKKKIFTVLIISASILFLLANSKTLSSPARINFSDIFISPLRFIHNVVSVSKNLIPFASLREENAVLRKKVELISRRLEENKSIVIENNRLKELINFRKTIPYTTVPAQVIGRDPTNWSNSLIIDKGLKGGVKRNKAVVSTKGLVGRLLEVGNYSSKILLITDPNSKVGVVVQRNRQGGILIGRPDGRCKMIYIALDSDVAKGDKVITAGFGGVFPKDIIVGEVVRIDKEPGRLYKYAIVRPAEDLSRLEEVLCIK